ncbi:MAG: hypothetical protein IJP14_00470 [Clostridia bacterium]|nr:hypothetical protein [Clostridia bacterium]
MCMICGLRYCPASCPGYDAAEDPWVTGYCERCQTALYTEGKRLCDHCEDVKDKEDKDDGTQ